jgi:ABC-type transport system involved in multi-copper enzyme maturation permease subunit
VKRLLAADRVRFGRRLDLWVLVALVPLVMAVLFVMEFNTLTTPPSMDVVTEPYDPVAEADIRAQMLANWRAQMTIELPSFAFPASLLKVIGNLGPPALLAIYLAVALTAGEFEWGTVRTIHLTASRGRTLATRFLVIVGLLGIALLLALALGAILPFLMSVEGAPLQASAATTPDLLAQILLRCAIVLPFAAMPALLAVLTRSMSLAFLLTVLLLAADLALASTPFWTTSPIPWLPALTISGSINRLLSPGSDIARIVPASVSLAALLAWGILPMLLAIARFRRLDINE